MQQASSSRDSKHIKSELILSYLNQPQVDIRQLREFALSEHGLVNNSIRKRVWPLLLNINVSTIPEHTELIQEHPDTHQVEKDVERSLWKFTEGNPDLLIQKRKELSNIIMAVLSSHPTLKYFQGYHDIGSVLLMVSNERLAFAMLEKLSLFHIRYPNPITQSQIMYLTIDRDALRPNLDYIIAYLSHLVPLLSLNDSVVAKFIVDSQVQPFFALSWVLTWFAHNLDDISFAARLFDVFLSTSPLMPIYVSSSIIEHVRAGVLSQDAVHGFLVPAPANAISKQKNGSDADSTSDEDSDGSDAKSESENASDNTKPAFSEDEDSENGDHNNGNDADNNNGDKTDSENNDDNANTSANIADSDDINTNDANNANTTDSTDSTDSTDNNTDSADNNTDNADNSITTTKIKDPSPKVDDDSVNNKSKAKRLKLYRSSIMEKIIFRSIQSYYYYPPNRLMQLAHTSLPADSSPRNYPFPWLIMSPYSTIKFKWFMLKTFRKTISLRMLLYIMIVPVSIVVYYLYKE